MSWIQIGSNINGEATEDEFGYSLSLSSNGDIIAIGAPYNYGSNYGSVNIYQNINNNWSQIGNIIGEGSGDLSGYSVSLSDDGTIVVIGAPKNNNSYGNDAGSTRVYKNINGTWNKISTDSYFDGGQAGGNQGTAVAISGNGLVIARGGPYADDNSTADGTNAGSVKISSYSSGTTWTQKGSVIYGEREDSRSGWSLAVNNNGTVVAVGAPKNNKYTGDGTKYNVGYVQVYKYETHNTMYGTVTDWNTIFGFTGNNSDEYTGWSVSLNSAGNIVAFGIPYANSNGITNSGKVKVYSLGQNTQIGGDINGENDGDKFGWSVSLSSDGNILAVGAPYNNYNGTDAGKVSIYKNINNVWTKIPTNGDIYGNSAGDEFGWSVSLSSDGTVLAVGSHNDDPNGTDSGSVSIFRYRPNPPIPSVSSITFSQTTATINFTQPTDTTNTPITSYRYTYSTDGTNYISYITSNWTTGTSFTVSDLNVGTTYYFKISAYNNYYYSDDSNVFQTTVPNYPPNAPTISSITVLQGTATINFIAGSSNGSNAVSNYKYALSQNGTNYSSYFTSNWTTGTSFTIPNLTVGATYYFKIIAYNGLDSNPSSASSSITIPNFPPSAPIILSGYGIDSTAIINFTPGTNNGSAAITNYAYSTDSVITQNSVFTLLPISSNTSPLTISGLINNQTYSITLKAFNGLYSSESNTISNIEITKSQDPPVITSILGNGSGIATVTFTQLLKQNNSIQNYYYNYSYGSYNSGWVLFDPPQTSSPLIIDTSTSLPNLNFTLRSFNGYNSKNSNTISNVPIIFDAPPVPVITSILFVNNKIRVSVSPQTISPSIIKYVYSTSQFINGRTVFSDFDNTPGVNEFTYLDSGNDIIYVTVKAFNGAFSLPSKTNEYKILLNTVSSGTNNTIFISTRTAQGLTAVDLGKNRQHICYSLDNQLTWTPIQRWPFVIGNPSSTTLTVKFSTNILLYYSNLKNYNTSDKQNLNILPINTNTTSNFFIINGNNITIDGDNNDVLIDSPPDFLPQTSFSLFNGLIQNGSEYSNGYDNITIKNINIKNFSSNSRLKEGEGLICKSYFGKASLNNLITNCDIYKHSNTNWRGKISKNSGGISGQYTGINSTNFIISNCTIENDIDTGLNGENAGGIIGANSGSLSNLLITNCVYTGSILGKGSGGIIGAMSSNIKITNCSTSGEIYSGGITGTLTGVFTILNDGLVEITDCITSGDIISVDNNNYPGGIVSDYACNVKITRCCSTGQIGNIGKNSSGGIIGSFAGSNNGSVLIDRCSSLGNISDNCGGIAGDNFGVYSGKIHIIKLSYSVGSIGNNAGGIVGPNIAPNYPNYLNYNFITSPSNPVFNGLGYGYGSSTGSSNRNAFINILGCFSYGSLSNTYSGGIIARTTQTYPAFLTDNKFFLRMLTIYGCASYGIPITTNVIQNSYQNFVTLDYENIYNNNRIIGGDSTLPPVQGIFNKTITEYDGDLLTDISNIILDPLTSTLNNSDIKPRINTGLYIGLNYLPSSISLSTLLLLAYPINQLVSSNKTTLYNILNNTNVTPSVLTSSYGGYTIRTIVNNSITILPLLLTKFNMTYSDLVSQGILPYEFYTAGIYSISWFRNTLEYKITDFINGGFNLLSLFPTYTIYDFFNQGHSINLFYNNNISAFDVRWINGITPYHFEGSLYDSVSLSNAWLKKQDGTWLGSSQSETNLINFYKNIFKNMGIILSQSSDNEKISSLVYQLPSNFTYSDLVGSNIQVDELIRFRDFSKNKIVSVNYYSVAQLRAGGFTASDLKTAGYTNAQMISGGFTTEQVNASQIQSRQPSPVITRIEKYSGSIKVFFRQIETNCSAPIISYYYSLDGTTFKLLREPFQTTSPLTIDIPSGTVTISNLHIGSFNGLPSSIPNKLVNLESISFNSISSLTQSVIEGLNIAGLNLNSDILPNAGVTTIPLPGPYYLGTGVNTVLGTGFGYGMSVLPGSDPNIGTTPTFQGSDLHIFRNIATQLVSLAINSAPLIDTTTSLSNKITQWQNYQDQQIWLNENHKKLVSTQFTIDVLNRNVNITNITYTYSTLGSIGYQLKIYFTITGTGVVNGYQYRITNNNYSSEWKNIQGSTSPLIVNNLLINTSIINNIQIRAYNTQSTLYNGIYSKLVNKPNNYSEYNYPIEQITLSNASSSYQLQIPLPNMSPQIKMNSITPTLPEIYPSLTEPNVLYVSFEQKDYNCGGVITKYACSVDGGKTYLYSDTLQSPQNVPYNLQSPIMFRGLPAGINMDARFKSWNGTLSKDISYTTSKVTVYGAPVAPVITKVTPRAMLNNRYLIYIRINVPKNITKREYSTDNGTTWVDIGVAPNAGYYNITVPSSWNGGPYGLTRGVTYNILIRDTNELPVGQLPPSITTPNNVYNQQNIKLRDQGFRFGFKSQVSNLWTINY
jgi:hypothetical protein